VYFNLSPPLSFMFFSFIRIFMVVDWLLTEKVKIEPGRVDLPLETTHPAKT
jgi:hypothetical protein